MCLAQVAFIERVCSPNCCELRGVGGKASDPEPTLGDTMFKGGREGNLLHKYSLQQAALAGEGN